MLQINWKIKAILYKILSVLKLEKTLFFIQKKITKRAKIDINDIKYYWKNHLKYLKSQKSINIIEFGAGKSLEQNIYLNYEFDNNLSQTVIDLSSMLDIGLFNEANKQIAKVLNINKKPYVKNINDIKNLFNIQYLAPCDIKEIENKKMVFDSCISSTTLEHLSLKQLSDTFLRLKKIIKKDGIISSLIDYSDHYSHTDRNIGALNFLKFDQNEWKKFNNVYLFQNRLRHQDYRNFFLKHNFEILEEIKGTIGEPPKNISNIFDASDKETYILWGHFLLKNT